MAPGKPVASLFQSTKRIERPVCTPGCSEDADGLHDQRRARTVVIRRLTPADAVPVRPDDVHFLWMRRTDLGAEHLLPIAGSARRRVQRPQRRIGLRRRIAVDPGLGSHPALTSAALGLTRRHRRSTRLAGISRVLLIFDSPRRSRSRPRTVDPALSRLKCGSPRPSSPRRLPSAPRSASGAHGWSDAIPRSCLPCSSRARTPRSARGLRCR